MRLRSLLPLAIILLSEALCAQTTATAPKFTSVPPIEDRELYYSFFNYHQGQVNTMQAAIAASPQSSAQLNQQMATQIGVDVKELQTVIANTQQVTQKYAAVAAARQTFIPVSRPARGQPTATQANAQFELQRLRVTLGGVSSLYISLSPASWAGLHNYIIGAYKTTVYKH